ncbi:MAG: FecR domain-containing protein [Pseudomonadota bacterium]
MAGMTQSSTQQGRAVVAIAVVVCLLAAYGLYLAPASNSVGDIYRSVSPENAPFAAGTSGQLSNQLQTAAGQQLGIGLRNGANLRIDELSQAALHSDEVVSLSHGRLYWDAGVAASGRQMTVTTEQGQLRARDAQLEVTLTGASLQVRLRSGTAVFESSIDADTTALLPGTTLLHDGEAFQLVDSAGDAASWAWTQGLAPTPEPSDVNALEYLEWAAHETGRQLHFANGASAQVARNTALDSAMDMTTPELSLKWMRANSEFGSKVHYSDSAITVR